MQLRDYQTKGIVDVSRMLAAGKKRVVFQLPTGGGKTVVFSAITKRYLQRSQKPVIIIVHREELFRQTRETLFDKFGITSEPIIAGMKKIKPSEVYVAMVESTQSRLSKLPEMPGLVIIDEAHIANFNKLLGDFPHSLIVGFTATPVSSNKKQPLNKTYEDIVCGPHIYQLIKSGSLCQNITFAPQDIVERAALTLKAGEFDESVMASQFSKTRYVNNTLRFYKKWAEGEKTIIFNCNIEHSKRVTDAFRLAGRNAKHLDGSMSKTERRQTLMWFKNTPGAILNNVGVLTAGFDEPSITTVIINLATKSLTKWLQMTGRGSRPFPGKEFFKIIDLGGNALEHGDWNHPHNWYDMFHNPKKARDKKGIPPVKSCPKCDAIIPAQSRSCEFCGHTFHVKHEATEEELSELIVITKGIDIKKILNRNQEKKDYFAFFEAGRKIAAKAKKPLTNENINQLYEEYLLHIKIWCKATGRNFSSSHENIAREHFLKCLQPPETPKLKPIQMQQMKLSL